MKIKYIILFLTCLLLLSSFTAPATACCEPPAPPCHHCEDTVWVWDCGAGQICCNGTCCDSSDCCNDEICCNSGDNCCTDSGAYCCDPTDICCEGDCCDPDECEECVDGVCEYQCHPCKVCDGAGSCVYPEGHDCETDNDCPGIQECISCTCKCDDSDEEETAVVGYEWDASGLLSGVEDAISAVPHLEASGFYLEVGIDVNDGNECCDDSDTAFTTYYKLYGTADMGGNILIDAIGAKDFHFEKTWDGYGWINANLELDVGPSVNFDANGTVSGKISDCGACLTAEGDVSITIKIEVTGDANVTVGVEETWLWEEFELTVAFTASGSVTAGAGAGGTYETGSTCDDPGFTTGCLKIDEIVAEGGIEFKVGPWGPYGVSGSVDIWDGWDNGKCGGT